MIPLLRRLLIVCLFGMALLLLLEFTLTRDAVLPQYFKLHASGTTGAGDPVEWEFTVNEIGNGRLDGRPATLDQVIDEVIGWDGTLKLQASGAHREANWEAQIANKGVTLKGAYAKWAELGAILRRTALPGGVEPTQAVTVADVLREAEAGNIPMPTRSKVSFPEFSYRQAFPDATDEPEYVISQFHQAPMLADLDSIPANLRKHYGDSLPPVAERLPRNPAVVLGPDGVGNYGGTWRRCCSDITSFETKIAYESFIRFDPAGRVQPCLAYKWDITDNNRVYTFYLRKGHRWSDGYPFTTEDILWVTNTLIGSEYWGDSPNWMLETDGHALLYTEDIRDWGALAARILTETEADGPSLGKQLALVDGERLLPLLRQVEPGAAPEELLQFKIVDRLNSAFREPAMFNNGVYTSLPLLEELAALEAIGYSRLSPEQMERAFVLRGRNDLVRRADNDIAELVAAELNRLNLLIFRLYYRDWVAPARVKMVKIEAVPDEEGDTSHIIRFTFPRPNSIFLEKTGTFMFYRGLFGLPKHYTARFHPLGTNRLTLTDILDWAGLFKLIRTQADGASDTPGKRVWNLLGQDLRNRIADTPPSADSDEAYRGQITEALNDVFTRREFYDRAAWAGIDVEAAPNKLIGEGFSYLRRDRAGRNLLRQMLIRNDRLARVHAKGVDDLSDTELFEFNQAMFRAAFDNTAQATALVATNREEGLNVAAGNHPRKYSSWVNLMRRVGVYHPTECPNYPTIRAWRVVTEPIEQTMVAVRNPYYYRVDTEGNQLPYLDVVETKKETEKPNILLTLASGNADFQCRDLTFKDFSYLKAHEQQGDYKILLWANDYCGEVNFYPLQAHKDPVMAELQTHPEFRHALSLAIDRQEIIDVVFGGIGEPGQFAVPEGSPYYNATLAKMSIEYDPLKASRMLDRMGLDKRDAHGVRLLSDGRPLIMNVDVNAQHPQAAVELVCAYWQEIGIDARLQVRGQQLINRMHGIGILDIGAAKEGGNYRGPMQAGGFAPTHPAECGQWSQWVAYLRSGGRGGWEPPEGLREIDRLWERVINAENEQAKFDAWADLAERTAHDLPMIGLMTSPGRVVYVKNGFKNVPRLAMAGWIAHEPGNTCPEAYYFEQER